MTETEKRTFGVFSPDGTCYDDNGREWENVQLIDIIKARTLEEALAEAKATLHDGAYEGFDYLHLRELGEAVEIDAESFGHA